MISTLKTGLERIRSRPGGALALPPAVTRSLMPLMVLAIGVTALVLMYFWHDQSAYKPVFGAREKVAVSDMIAVLDAEHVPYRLHPDSGQVLVPEGQLGKVRMLLAGKGVTAKLPAGLELMDRNDPLGVSQFVQDVRFRRGLEGELAQSIMALDAVDSARVHLSIAKSTSFVTSDGEKSSASVVLALKAGRTLVPEQIASIVNLVAGSVASLTPQRVSLVDQAGNLLSSRIDLADGNFDSNSGNEGAKRFQDETRRNVHDLLAPVLGDDNFKTSVTAVIDNDRVEETLEKYGEAPKVTSEATREEQDRNRLAMGVPGSLSNRPVAVAAPASGADDGGSAARKNATTRQYAYDRSITQIKHGRGGLQKLSVAVVLNNAAAPTPKTGWSTAEIANIEKILRNGLGIDAKRGDNLVVSALSFPVPQPPLAWWQQRDNQIDIGTWVVYLVGTLLGYMLIVRPLMRSVQLRLAAPERRARPLHEPGAAKSSDAPALRAPEAHAAPALAMAGGVAQANAHANAQGTAQMPVVPLLENYDLPPPGSPVDVMVEHLKVLAGKEPERVAEVVKQWVQKNGRSE
ncbi:flagellar basal-body MS-ring/collar protein FliF [soil metagenome]